MLKMMKYDIKSVIVIPLLAIFTALVIMITELITIGDAQGSISELTSTFSVFSNLYLICYIIAAIAVIGFLWKKSSTDIELYEMAGISPLKVGASRMLLTFISMTVVSAVLTVIDTSLNGYFVNKFSTLPYIPYGGIFTIYQLPWTNIFTPLVMGLFMAVIYTSSFLFAMVNRRIRNNLISTFLLGGVIALVVILNVSVVNHINLNLAVLNLNKLFGVLIIERCGPMFSPQYQSISYLICPNFLNLGFLAFQGFYVTLMFSAYSLRRNLK